MANSKKIVIKTSQAQFKRLIALMDEYPQAPLGLPPTANNNNIWDMITEDLNSLGPPERNMRKWKKIWADLKSRTKKTVIENNRLISELGAEAAKSVIKPLNQMELEIERICKLSPKVCDIKLEFESESDTQLISSDPTTSGKAKRKALLEPSTDEEGSTDIDIKEEFEMEIGPTTSPTRASTAIPTLSSLASSTTVKPGFRRVVQLKGKKREKCLKRKLKSSNGQFTEGRREQMELLRQQLNLEQSMLVAMKMQADSAEASAEALQSIAESTKFMAKAMMAVVKHLTERK